MAHVLPQKMKVHSPTVSRPGALNTPSRWVKDPILFLGSIVAVAIRAIKGFSLSNDNVHRRIERG